MNPDASLGPAPEGPLYTAWLMGPMGGGTYAHGLSARAALDLAHGIRRRTGYPERVIEEVVTDPSGDVVEMREEG